MKNFVFLVIGVSAIIALSSARSDPRGHGPLVDEYNYDGYESLDASDEEESYKNFHCFSEQQECMVALHSKYTRPHNFAQSLDLIKSAGAQTVCSDILKASKCLSASVAQPICSGIPDHTRRVISSMSSLTDFICTDRFSDLVEHWDCVTDLNILSGANSCIVPSGFSSTGCYTPPYTDCIASKVNLSSSCKSGAVDFMDAVMDKIPLYFFGCPENKNSAKSLKKFWKYIM